jgi:hypothetical protein
MPVEKISISLPDDTHRIAKEFAESNREFGSISRYIARVLEADLARRGIRVGEPESGSHHATSLPDLAAEKGFAGKSEKALSGQSPASSVRRRKGRKPGSGGRTAA